MNMSNDGWQPDEHVSSWSFATPSTAGDSVSHTPPLPESHDVVVVRSPVHDHREAPASSSASSVSVVHVFAELPAELRPLTLKLVRWMGVEKIMFSLSE